MIVNSCSCEGACPVVRDALAHDVIASAGELVRHGLDRHDGQTFGTLALVKAPDRRIVSNRVVRSLDERPAEWLVAALAVADALVLTVRLAPTVDHTCAGGELAHRGEPMDVTSLQRDRQRKDIADTAHGLQPMELLAQPAFGED